MVKSHNTIMVTWKCVKCGKEIWALLRHESINEELRKALCPRCDGSSNWHQTR